MNFFHSKHYFLFGLLLSVAICPMNIGSMSTTSKQDTAALIKQSAAQFHEAQTLLTKKHYNSKRAQELLKGILSPLLTLINAANVDMHSLMHSKLILFHTIEALSSIDEQEGKLDKAIEYWNIAGIPNGLSIPQKFQLLFKHKKDSAHRLAQFDQIHDQLIKLLQQDDGTDGYSVANYVYGMSLIANGDIKEGVKHLEKIPLESSKDLSILQLYIAYKFGFYGVLPDSTKEAFYQKALQKRLQSFQKQHLTTTEKSYYFIRGFIKLFGLLGEKKNIAEGLKLIDDAENYVDDIYITINDLFPQLEQIKKDYADETNARAAELKALEKELCAEQPKQKQNPKRKKLFPEPVKKEPATSSSSSPSEPVATPTFSIATELTPEKWNEYFIPLLIKKFGNNYDDSAVKEINIPNKTITISDPMRNEELIVHASEIPHRSFKDIGDLDYDEQRIAERQNTGKEMSNYVHQFAQMLDFVIQYVGDLVPFLQMGNNPQESLQAPVERINLSTKKRQQTVAQYTFGKDFNAPHKRSFTVVYHRVLKPNEGNARIIESMHENSLASSSGVITKSKKK